MKLKSISASYFERVIVLTIVFCLPSILIILLIYKLNFKLIIFLLSFITPLILFGITELILIKLLPYKYQILRRDENYNLYIDKSLIPKENIDYIQPINYSRVEIGITIFEIYLLPGIKINNEIYTRLIIIDHIFDKIDIPSDNKIIQNIIKSGIPRSKIRDIYYKKLILI